MRYESIRIRGLGQFDDVELDLTELTGLVGVTGPNGAGKTTLLELLTGGSSYRQCPTRGSLVKLAGDRRDGLLEVRVDNGTSYTLKHLLDGVSGKSEASVTNGQGQPVLETTKVREFDAWAAKHLMPPEVLYSGAVAVQGRRGFLDLTPGDRKGMFLRAIGNEHLEAKADRARERAREARRDVEVAERATEDERARTGDLDEAQGALDDARRVADEATETVARIRAELDALRERAAEAEKGFEATRQRGAVQLRREAIQKRLADLETRLENNRMLLDRAEEVRGAVAWDALIAAALSGLPRETESVEVSVPGSVAWRAEPVDEHRFRVVPVVGLDPDGGAAVLPLAGAAPEPAPPDHDVGVGAASGSQPVPGAEVPVAGTVGASVGVEAAPAPALVGDPRLTAALGAELHVSSVTLVDTLNESGLRGLLSKLETECVAADGRAGKARAAVAGQERHVQDADRAVERIEKRLGDEESVLAAVKALPTMAESVASLEREFVDVEARISHANDMLVHGKDTRILNLRTGLERINDSFDEDHDIPRVVADRPLSEIRATAQAALDGDDESAKAGEAAPGAVADGREELDRIRRLLDEGRTLLAESERLAALAPGLETARAELAEAEKAEEAADRMLEAANAAAGESYAEHGAALTALDDACANLENVETEKRSIPMKVLALAPKLANAEERVEELTTDIAAAHTELKAADEEMDDLPAAPDVEPVSDNAIAIAKKRLAAAEDLASRAGVSIGTTEALVTRAEEGATRIAELVMAERAAGERYSDWERLSQDLGRDGLQAYEIDAAVPELNAIANDLLHNCHGPRFTAEVTTKRLDATGKRELEGLDVNVVDTEKGRDALAETYSGGELVIVGEAIALGITQISCRRAGLERPSIVRDESGAALDPENTRAYAAMLRRAMEAMGAQHVLLVSHSPEMQALVDHRIEISATGLEVVS